MKVAFLLGSAHVGGGTYVVFQHALGMRAAGWEVDIVTEEPVPPEMLRWHAEARDALHFRTFDQAQGTCYDIAFATWWKTVYRLHRIEAAVYAYFVQSIESRFFPDWDIAARNYIEATYTYRLPVITEAGWIKEYLETRYGQQVAVVRNGIRKDLYHSEVTPLEPRKENTLRVLIEGPFGVFFKNVEKTIELCGASKADEIWLMTSSAHVAHFPGVDRLFSCVPIEEAARVYASCDVIVKLSYVEGMFGPPLEMFHCGGTAIVYAVTGHEEYIRHGENAIVCNRDDDEAVLAALNRMKDRPDYLAALQQGAVTTARQWLSWKESSEAFCAAALGLRAATSERRHDLANRNERLTRWYEEHARQQEKFYELRARLPG